MKIFKKILSLCLVIIIIFSSLPISNFNTLGLGVISNETNYKVGTILEFGSYPQSEVVDNVLLSTLNSLAPSWSNWINYGYYSGDGSVGSMAEGDWMRYVDVEYNEQKYRGVKFTQYRPYYTYSTSSLTYQDDSGYILNTVYWFKFEPLKWRMLDPVNGLVICDTIIDSQPYNNTLYCIGNGMYDYFNDTDHKFYANNYEKSSIRAWLNKDFYYTAFTEAERQQIGNANINNAGYYTSIGVEEFKKLDGDKLRDKIFLLSYNEVKKDQYDFNSDSVKFDVMRMAKGSDYAKIQGLYVFSDPGKNYDGNSFWTLRTPGSTSDCSCYVTYQGCSRSFYGTDYTGGVRPAFCFGWGDCGEDLGNPLGNFEGFKQEHVIENWRVLNQSYKSEYLAGFAMPMDGTNGNPNYLIPGQSENMIPQGLTYWPEKDWVLVSSYDKSKENPSAIFALDRETGAFVAQFNMYDEDGNAWKPHAGGIGVSDNNLYITSGKGVAYFKLSDLDVPSGTVKDIKRKDRVTLSQLNNTNAAYISVSDGMLWTGNFYSNYPGWTGVEIIGEILTILPPDWDTPAANDYNSIVLGFKLSGNNSESEWNNLVNMKKSATYRIGIDNELECIQGISFKNMGANTYKMYLSRTTDVSFSASISTATVTLKDKSNIEIKENKFSYYKNLPGTEGIVFIGDDLHILYESGALSTCDNIVSNVLWSKNLKNCTDVIWKVNESDLLQIPNIDGTFFDYSSYYKYNHDIAQFCADYCVLGYNYNNDEISYYLSKSGFILKSCNMNASRDQVNYFIAEKDVIVDGVSKKLIFIGCIGSYKDQWYSNFDPLRKKNNSSYTPLNEADGVHLGFADARDYVFSELKNYIDKNNVDESKAIVLLTGHSRGAATVNLLAAKLIDDDSEINVNTYRLYTYGFATPNTVLRSKDIYDEKYDSIRNIVNPEDLVTKLLPREWGYGRYGITYTLPSKTNDYVANSTYLKDAQKYSVLNGLKEEFKPYKDGEVTVHNLMVDMSAHLPKIEDFYDKKDFYTSMSSFTYFRDCILPYVAGGANWMDYTITGATLLKFGTLQQKVTTFFLNHQKLRPDFENSHLMQTYAAYVKTLSSSELTAKRKGYEGTVNCPVDIEIYDKQTGELVGRIVDNVVDEEISAKENSVVMSVDGDSKSFWLPSNGDYDIKLIGNDDGTMDYSMSEIDSDIGEIKRSNFFDIEITDGLTMTADVQGENFIIEEHELVYKNGDILEPTEILGEEEITVFNIEITSAKGGFASLSQTAKSGDYVSLEAKPEDGWKFIGWYENDKLVSSESAYAFVAKSDRNLEARFEHIDHNFDDWYTVTPATCNNIGVTQRACLVCSCVETKESPALEHSYESIVTYATCSSNGYTTYTCTVCKEGYTSDFKDKLPHNLGEWYVEIPAGCIVEGLEKHKCSECDYFESKSIASNGHDFGGGGSECLKCGFNRSTECSCNCHTSGLKNLLFKIILFFQKLFNNNKMCNCGVYHY